MMTRRKFGLGLASALAGAALGQDKVKPSVFGRVQIGLQSYTFRKFSIERMIAAMKDIGISSVELWDGHLHPMKASEADFKEAREKFDRAGIRVSAYCVNFPPDPSDLYLDRAFNGALLLGTRIITSSVKKVVVPKLDLWCKKYRIKLGLHNHWFGEPWYRGNRSEEFETPQDFLDALKSSSQYMSINLDIGHFWAAGYDPVSFIREHHKRIVSLHIKDRDRDERRTQRRFGQGSTPIIQVMKLLKQVRFSYAANIEYELEPDDPTEGVRHALDYLRRALS
jgi:sugar phosphate isomerase/epimerase